KRVFRIFYFFLITLSLYSCATARQRTELVISMPASIDKEVNEAVQDMVQWLNKAGATSVRIGRDNSNNGKGIRLIQSGSISDKSKRGEIEKDGQSFWLTINGYNDVQIIGSGVNSFINGIYTYLHELGFRWYMPGDNWTKLGQLATTIKIDKFYRPDFRDRTYAGSGALSPIPAIDEKNTFKTDFLTWNKRNRYATDYVTKGHSGAQFYNDNKAVLDKHPEYF